MRRRAFFSLILAPFLAKLRKFLPNPKPTGIDWASINAYTETYITPVLSGSVFLDSPIFERLIMMESTARGRGHYLERYYLERGRTSNGWTPEPQTETRRPDASA